MKFYVKIIRNRTNYTEDDIQKFLAWIKRNTPLEPEVDFVDSDLPLKWKDFNVPALDGTGRRFWGLDGIKEQLRQANLVPQSQYHIVIFLYDSSGFGEMTPERSLAHWTYPNSLNGAAFMEVAATTYWETVDDQYRVLTHEFLHACHRLALWQGIATKDTLDVYDLEFEPDAPAGNRARNLLELSPHWLKIAKEPSKVTVFRLTIEVLKLQIQVLLKKLGVKKPVVEDKPMGNGNLIIPEKSLMDKLITAIIKVESGGDDNAIGDKNLIYKAYGPMQIRQPVVIDVNRRFKTKYEAKDMLGNRELSKWVFRKYMEIYSPNGSAERMARIWNGGPLGYTRYATLGYWNKVKAYLL